MKPMLLAALSTLCFVTGIIADDLDEQWDALPEPTAIFATLLHSGNLPGVPQGQHGEFFAAMEPPDAKVAFPMTVKVTLTITGSPRRFYLLEKEAEDTMWLITKSWTTDSDGKDKMLPLPNEEAQIKANKTIQQ